MNQLCSVSIDEREYDHQDQYAEMIADEYRTEQDAIRGEIETASQLGEEVDWVRSLGLESSHEYIIASIIIVTDTDTSCAEKIALLHDLMDSQIKPYAAQEEKKCAAY